MSLTNVFRFYGDIRRGKELFRFLFAQVQEIKSERTDLKTLLEEMRHHLKEARRQMEKKDESKPSMLSNIERLMKELSEVRMEKNRLTSANASLTEQISVLKKLCYESPSQRNR